MFPYSIIDATADLQPYNGKHGYDIQLIGSAMGNTTDDTLTNRDILSSLTLNTVATQEQIFMLRLQIHMALDTVKFMHKIQIQ